MKVMLIAESIKKYPPEAIVAERCFIARYIGISAEKIYPTDILASYIIDGWEYDDELYDLLQNEVTLQDRCVDLILMRLLNEKRK